MLLHPLPPPWGPVPDTLDPAVCPCCGGALPEPHDVFRFPITLGDTWEPEPEPLPVFVKDSVPDREVLRVSGVGVDLILFLLGEGSC